MEDEIKPGSRANLSPAGRSRSGATASYAKGLWTHVPAAAPGARISSLSCAAVNSCVATGENNDVLFYAPPQTG